MSEQPDWTEQARRLIAGLGGMLSAEPPHGAGPSSATSSGSCRWCPLCQAAAGLRGERPEVTTAMADLLTTAAAALRAYAAPAAAEESAAAEERAAPAEPPRQEPDRSTGAGPGVQRIEIA